MGERATPLRAVPFPAAAKERAEDGASAISMDG